MNIAYCRILEYYSIKYIFIRNISAKFSTYNSPQSPDIGQNSDGNISDFWFSDQSLINKNCHNLRTSNDIDMKLGPVTNFDKRNKTMLKNLIMMLCRYSTRSASFFQFMTDFEQSRSLILNALFIFININLLSYKN